MTQITGTVRKCWIPKATNTHSEYIILIAFELLRLLHESTYIASLVNVYYFRQFPRVNKLQITPQVAFPVIQFHTLYFTMYKLTACDKVTTVVTIYLAYVPEFVHLLNQSRKQYENSRVFVYIIHT